MLPNDEFANGSHVPAVLLMPSTTGSAQCNNSVGDSVVLARLIFLANARVFGIDMTSLYMLMIR